MCEVDAQGKNFFFFEMSVAYLTHIVRFGCLLLLAGILPLHLFLVSGDYFKTNGTKRPIRGKKS